MTTAYTSLLGLALPVTGELSGTWGDTVNDYITKYLDASVAGTQTISGSQTAVTLSVTNGTTLSQVGSGATGSAQYNIINCTGNPASMLTVTVPAASKTYVVVNATSTNQQVKIVGAGPTTGVTLDAGEKAVIAWNGSDFIKIATSAVDGVSTFSAGTTGFTPSTATSGAVTLGGTLATTNGGTGLTSFTANRVFYASSTSAIGQSANLTFDGTTLTANALTTTSTVTLNGGTANGVAYLNGSKVLTTGSALTFDGTNLSTGSGSFLANGTTGITSFRATTTSNYAELQSRPDISYSRLLSSAYLLDIATLANQPILFTVNSSEQMRLTSTGLGIGTSSPANKLDVVGAAPTIRVYSNNSGATTATMLIDAFDNTGFSDLSFSRAQLTATQRIRALHSGTVANQSLAFWTGGSETMRLDGSGNLGIGTSSPSVKLDVFGRAKIDVGTYASGYALTLGAISETGRTYQIGMVTGGSLAIYDTTAAAQRIVLDSSGNLGIGTSSPATQFVVSNAGAQGVEITGSNGSIQVYNRSTSAYGTMNLYANTLYFRTGVSPAINMTLDSSGNLGIGTSSPAYKLDVVGPVQSSAGYYINGNTSGGYVWVRDNYALRFGTNDTERMRLDSSGNLGIGTSSPVAKLDINGNQSFSDSSFIIGYGLNTQTGTIAGATSPFYGLNMATFTGFSGQGIGLHGYYGLLFSTTGTERARITSGGNLLVKTTADNGVTCHFNGGANANIIRLTGASTTNSGYIGMDGDNFTISTGASILERARITSGGNLLVGTTTGNGRLSVLAPADGSASYALLDTSLAATAYAEFKSQGATYGYIGSGTALVSTGASTQLAIRSESSLLFSTGTTERARITSGGDFYVGTTNALTAAGRISVAFDQASAYGLILRNTNATATSIFVSFENSTGGSNGNISQTNSTTVAYNTSSDRRLKKDIMPAPQAGADIDAIEVVSHGWVSNNDTVKYGVVAQDLQAVAPQAVSAGDDGEEIERTWGVDYSKLVPMLIKEIQSLRARVAALETK